MRNIKKRTKVTDMESEENLGLDADRSQERNTLNDDNDRVTGNSNGESDESGDDDHATGTPLDEK